MALSFLSVEWFQAAMGAAEAQAIDLELNARVCFRIEGTGSGTVWGLVVAEGCVRDWALGELAEPDLEIRLTLDHAWRLHADLVDGNEALRHVRVLTPGTAGPGGPPSPMDLGERPELSELPRIPGASLDVQYHYHSGPWGPVSYGLSFHDGRVSSMVLGELADPDVTAGSSFLQMAQVRAGDLGILEALANGGTVQGSEGALALLGGISESPEFRRAERACGPSGRILGVLGMLREDVLSPTRLASLIADTVPPAAANGGLPDG